MSRTTRTRWLPDPQGAIWDLVLVHNVRRWGECGCALCTIVKRRDKRAEHKRTRRQARAQIREELEA